MSHHLTVMKNVYLFPYANEFCSLLLRKKKKTKTFDVLTSLSNRWIGEFVWESAMTDGG